MSSEEIARFRRMFRSRSAALSEAETAGQDSRNPVELDQQAVGRLSRMDALQHQAMAQAGSRRRADEMRSLETAPGRLEKGGFGACLDCLEPIPVGRLELDPAAALCVLHFRLAPAAPPPVRRGT